MEYSEDCGLGAMTILKGCTGSCFRSQARWSEREEVGDLSEEVHCSWLLCGMLWPLGVGRSWTFRGHKTHVGTELVGEGVPQWAGLGGALGCPGRRTRSLVSGFKSQFHSCWTSDFAVT